MIDSGLLFKDLLARVPYGVKVSYTDKIYDVIGYSGNNLIIVLPFLSNLEAHPIETCKPYLRPMESMTKKEEKEYSKYAHFGNTLGDWVKSIDYLNSIHIDFRGLIPLGLALPAPDGMYHFK